MSNKNRALVVIGLGIALYVFSRIGFGGAAAELGGSILVILGVVDLLRKKNKD